jgi:hypothetical protein
MRYLLLLLLSEAVMFSSIVIHRCVRACRCGVEATPDTVAVFQVDNQSSRELRHYLTNIAGQCTAAVSARATPSGGEGDVYDSEDLAGRPRSSPAVTPLPRVVILDNLHRVTSLSDVFNGFLSVPYQCWSVYSRCLQCFGRRCIEQRSGQCVLPLFYLFIYYFLIHVFMCSSSSDGVAHDTRI